jgi:shikimate kinase
VIHLVGPGGAGKTTTGAALVDQLDIPFVDLDAEFAARFGDVSAYLDTHGYDAYAAAKMPAHHFRLQAVNDLHPATLNPRAQSNLSLSTAPSIGR